ncbi:MAG TPA: hypothetical protein VGX27_07455 [Candidatus Dormibacteraeota bacterium]|nr:hypothetical protein [Candidatus Dormibacteraeota bacterium]
MAVIAIFGVSADLGSLVSHRQNASSMSCAVSLGSVINGHQRLLVTASGLTPGTNYLEAQPGVQSVWITTDSAGASNNQSLYYNGPGKYTIAFDYYYFSNNKEVQATATSCSASL